MKRLVWLALLVGLIGCAGLFTTGMTHVQRIGWRQQVLQDLDSLWSWSQEERTELAFCLYGTMNVAGSAVHVREARALVHEVLL
jgi:hypothetical protein